MKYYLIAGETSGELHASHLMKSLREKDPEAEFRFIGGDMMKAEGGTLVRHYSTLAFMGFVPVLLHMRTIMRGMKECRRDILEWKPDVLILVDYPGFNLGVAKYVRQHDPSIRIFYYISPKIWAWKEWRMKSIRRYVDRIYSILPFEVEYFQNRHQYEIDYVGNPTVDEIDSYKKQNNPDFARFIVENNLDERPIIALLAGSRRQEIRDNLSRMIEAVRPLLADYQILVAGAPSIAPEFYSKWTESASVHVLYGQTYRILQHSTAALVTSGTATLETALFRVPQVVCYYLNAGWFYRFLRFVLVKAPYISLVNLVAGKEVVSELIGSDMTVESARRELLRILPRGERRETMLTDYEEVIRRLGEPGAPNRAAQYMFARLKTPSNSPGGGIS